MDPKELLLINNEIIQRQLMSICSDLTDEQVRFAHEAVDTRGLNNMVVHCYWSIGNRAQALLGHERQAAPEAPQTTADLVAFISQAHDRAEAAIKQITEAQLLDLVTLPYATMPGATAMMDGFAHAFRHIGNVLDARHLGGFETHALG